MSRIDRNGVFRLTDYYIINQADFDGLMQRVD